MIFFICSFKELNPNSIITHCTAGATKHHSYTTKRFIQSPEKKKNYHKGDFYSIPQYEKRNSCSPGKFLNKHCAIYAIYIYRRPNIGC